MTNGSESEVFISYRRVPDEGHAVWLRRDLTERFGKGFVHSDIDFNLGEDFVKEIRDAVGRCRVILVIVGPQWATLRKEGESTPRLENPMDFVRLEVKTALEREKARQDLTVIPVLVGRAEMPAGTELPEEIQPFAYRHAHEIDRRHFDDDLETLAEKLTDATGVQQIPDRQPPPPPPPHQIRPAMLLIGVIAAGIAGAIGRLIGQSIPTAEETEVAAQIAGNVLRRAEIWAVVGVTLGVWITLAQRHARQIASPLPLALLLGLLLGAIGGALGGAIFAVPKYAPDPALGDAELELFAIAATAVQGGFIGAVIGALWTPEKRTAMGFGVGAAAGALIQLLFNQTWDPSGTAESALLVGVESVVIVGAVLGILASAPRRVAAPPPAVSGTPATG